MRYNADSEMTCIELHEQESSIDPSHGRFRSSSFSLPRPEPISREFSSFIRQDLLSFIIRHYEQRSTTSNSNFPRYQGNLSGPTSIIFLVGGSFLGTDSVISRNIPRAVETEKNENEETERKGLHCGREVPKKCIGMESRIQSF